MKRLLCFFDGTWNRPDDLDALTNVVRLYRSVLPADAAGTVQIAHYEIGIATDKAYGRFAFPVGAVGIGVTDRIQSGLRFLATNYEPGDEIYLFGFSRGAYQARALGELIALAGIPRDAGRDAVERCWRVYGDADGAGDVDAEALQSLRAEAHWPVRIRCIGVWDTVGNLGLPLATRKLTDLGFSLHHKGLSPLVDVGLHALSIDEPRGPFSPTLWTMQPGEHLPYGQTIEQVWFPGCHANVGGGYKDHALSDISLLWMAERVVATTGAALDLVRLRRESVADPLGEAVQPTSDTVFRFSDVVPFVRLVHQDLGGLSLIRRGLLGGWRTSLLGREEISINERIHESALARLGKRVPVRRGDRSSYAVYRPRPLRRAISRKRVRRGFLRYRGPMPTGPMT